MLSIISGFLVIVLFTLRPFAYKPAARNFSPNTSSVFTAVWTVIISIFLLPLYYNKLFIDGQFFIFTKGFIASFLKGFAIFVLIKNSQILNKESTSAAVFWGPIGFAFGTLVNFLFLGEKLKTSQIWVIFVLFILGIAFFIVGEGKTLSRRSRIAFITIISVVILNIACDRYALTNMNWFAHLFGSYASMLFLSLLSGVKKQEVLACLKTKDTCVAGLIYAAGEFVVINSMQNYLGVSNSLFLIRVAQSLGLILAYHLYKEGKLGIQYSFAIIQILSAYFFFM